MSLILCILDGWGIAPEGKGNAITQADTPFFDSIPKDRIAKLEASAEHVGLPKLCMGNSEVGHMAMGAGRLILQDLPRIDSSIEKNELSKNTDLQELCSLLKNTNKTCHIIGLASDGRVHASIDHIIELNSIVKSYGVNVLLHPILDGRDTKPKSAITYIDTLNESCEIATIAGRYYSMDRDKRWERTQKSYNAMLYGSNDKNTRTFTSPNEAIESNYNENISDEFIPPQSNQSYKGIEEGDGLIFANFRPDRTRQLMEAFLGMNPQFNKVPFCNPIITMTSYSSQIDQHTRQLFHNQTFNKVLGEVISDAGLKQFRIAETEKYAHVTFFFNCGKEEPFIGETRTLIESKKVASYDLSPEMSAKEITTDLTKAILDQSYDFILVNYANADMVGHTGDFDATLKAVETIDSCMKEVYDAVNSTNSSMLITADHGNAEEMIKDDIEHKAHTLNKVPLISLGSSLDNISMRDGKLSDVAPTILDLMNLKQPKEMDGSSLVDKNEIN